MSGWCQDHRLFGPLVSILANDHQVVRIDWRGHGVDRSPVSDFGPDEQASDTLGALDSIGVEQFCCSRRLVRRWNSARIRHRTDRP
ncbi:alpha/beta fold hydrolase [Rhodococcus sp. IEGM 1318]|uniref:alpha/beta fold hydrolase n=1 Tax=Rhodococcus sp. IEGM 1318 TaxID=3082226 RepID=UPI003989F400